MYHPELYPELAAKNGLISPLTLPASKREKKSISTSALAPQSPQSPPTPINQNQNEPLKDNAAAEPELQTVEAEDVISLNRKSAEAPSGKFASLSKFIRRAAQQKSNYKEELATKYFEISSIRKEINQTGEVYFGINNYKNRAEVIDNYMSIMEADINDEKFEFNAHTKSLEREKFGFYAQYAPSAFVEKNRSNYLSSEAPALEDLLEELKAENRISSSAVDLSGIPATENAYGKVVRSTQDNLAKIKQYFEKLEKQSLNKTVKDFKAKSSSSKGSKGNGSNACSNSSNSKQKTVKPEKNDVSSNNKAKKEKAKH